MLFIEDKCLYNIQILWVFGIELRNNQLTLKAKPEINLTNSRKKFSMLKKTECSRYK